MTLSQPSMDKVIYGPNVSGGIPSPPPPEEPFLGEYAHEKVNKFMIQYHLYYLVYNIRNPTLNIFNRKSTFTFTAISSGNKTTTCC